MVPSETRPSIASVAPTICTLLGLRMPAQSEAPPIGEVIESSRHAFSGRTPRKALIYAPDAIGAALLRRLPDLEQELRGLSSLRVEVRSQTPPKTPVCFASIFTGAHPETHGIRRYERPVLRVETVFDVAIEAGLRVALVAVRDSSIDLIFRERPMDYHSLPYDPEATERAIRLLKRNEHDVLVVYHQEYDDILHREGPYSPDAIAAAGRHGASFAALSRVASEAWRDVDHFLAVTPDHGGHEVVEDAPSDASGRNVRGDHGEDIPEDMDVVHFWKFESSVGEGSTRPTGAPP